MAGYQPSAILEVVMAPEDAPLELVLGEGGGRIVGRVLDPDGQPVWGARVLGEPPGGELIDLPGGGCCSESPAPVADFTRTNGSFELPGDLEPGPQPIFAVARGYPIWEGECVALPARRTFLEIRLVRPARIEGVVTNDADEAVAGLRVSTARSGPKSMQSFEPFAPEVATTDADGAFVLDLVAPGTRVVTARDPARPRLGVAGGTVECISGQTSECELVLDTGKTIAGALVDGKGTPLVGWNVRAQPESSRGGFYVRADVTDERGAFLLVELTDTDHVVSAVAPGESPMLPRARASSIAPDSDPVRIVALHAGTTEGTYRGVVADREKLEGEATHLMIRPVDGMWFNTVAFDAGSGLFQGSIRPGEYRLRAFRGTELLGESDPFVVTAGEDVDIGLFDVSCD